MRLTSSAFSYGEPIPVQYTCKGDNVNPPLEISDIPEDTKSLVLAVTDEDATPSIWYHWFVFNIPPTVTEIKEKSIPKGAIVGHANGGTPGYEGPCPVYFLGEHEYVFKLYALDTMLEIEPTSTFLDAKNQIDQHTLATATLRGTAEGTGEKAEA